MKTKAIALSTLIGLCLFSCKLVSFPGDYFQHPERTAVDRTILGYYSIPQEETSGLLFILAKDDHTYGLCTFELSRPEVEPENFLTIQAIKVGDFFLAKITSPEAAPGRAEPDRPYHALLKFRPSGEDLELGVVILDLEGDFFEAAVRSGKLKGRIGGRSPDALDEDVVVTARLEEFENFILENKDALLEKMAQAGNGFIKLKRLVLPHSEDAP